MIFPLFSHNFPMTSPLTQVFPAPVAMLDGADRLTAARLVVPQTGRCRGVIPEEVWIDRWID
jgi:hypothetical protein